MDKNELILKLQRIDEEAFFSADYSPDARAAVVIVGSSALLLCDLSQKGATKDVDVLRVENRIRAALLSDADFNCQCAAYESCLPYNFEDRLVPINLGLRAIEVWVPSLEDLAVMKLYRWEAPDKADLKAEAVLNQLDWETLERLVFSADEAAASRAALPEDDRELKNLRHNYEEYRTECRK